MKVFAVAHDDSSVIRSSYMVPLRGGAAFARYIQPGYLRDDEGENISTRNKEWCENTAHYWIWKNTTDEIVGLCHYRRYFCPYDNEAYNTAMSFNQIERIVKSDDGGSVFIRILDGVDFIVPIPRRMSMPFQLDYILAHRMEDWGKLRESMLDVYPQEAKEAFCFFQSNTDFYEYHMFIARRSAVKAYYEWLFPLLLEVDRRITPSSNPYQARVIGFLAERLFPWWLHSRSPSRACLPVMTVTSPPCLDDFLRRTFVWRGLSRLALKKKLLNLDQQWTKHVQNKTL